MKQQQPIDAFQWFSGNDPDCPFNWVGLVNADAKFTTYTSSDLLLTAIGSQRMLTIKTDNLRNQTMAAVKGKTVSNIESIQKFYYQICQAPQANSSSFEFTLQKFSGKQTIQNATTMFVYPFACPVISYEIMAKQDDGTLVPYTGSDIILNSQNQIEVLATDTSFSKTLVVRVNAKLSTAASKEFTVHVCGIETMSLLLPQYQTMKFTFNQNQG